MLRRTAAALALALGLVPFTAPPVAHAQDDWEVRRDPFDRRVVARYKRLLEKDPHDAAALKKLVALYARYSTVDRLVAEVEAAFRKSPETSAYPVILGHLARSRGRLDEALAWYDRAAALRSGDAAVHIALGELHRQKRRLAEATAAFEKALALASAPKQKKTLLRTLADLALDQGDVDRARGFYRRLIELDPHDVSVRLDLADALSRHRLHAEARAEYEAALPLLGTDPARRVEVLARIGREHETLGQLDEAVSAYEKAIEKTPRGHHLRRELTERIVEIFRKRQDLRTLIARYEKEWPAPSRGHFEWDLLARLYEATGEQEKALFAYRKAVAAAPTELDTQRRLIALLEIFGKEAEAIAQYEAVIRIAPGEPRFRLELAERYHRRGERQKALAMLREVERRFPDDPGVHAILADLYARWGEDELALGSYERLTRIEPDDPGHLVNLGEQHFLRGDRQKAVEIWRRIAASKTPEGYARLAEVYLEHDMGPEAINTYLKAIALRPQDPTLYRGLAGALERQRQDDRAVEAWEKVLELTTGDAGKKALRREARTRIIAILYRKGGAGTDFFRRLGQWQRAFDAVPPDLEAGYFLAEAYLKRGEHGRARAVLEKLLQIDADDLDAMHQLVSVHRALREYDEAIALLQKLAEKSPGREREYYTQIAELELMLYRDDEAIAYAEKALEKSPNDPQAQERLAEIYEKKEDFARAVAAYRRAIELDPRNFKVHFSLARLYLRLGEHAEAARLYREVIRRATDEETIRSAARKAIDLEEYLGTLGELEQHIQPLAFLFSNKPIYRRLLVDLYERYVPRLAARARRGDEAARRELRRLGESGLKPLLEALADETDPAQRRVAVRVLGHLENRHAAGPLVRFATSVPEAGETPGSAPETRRARSTGGRAPVGDTPEMDLRIEALLAAGRLADPRVAPELASLLGHREKNVRWAAAWALGRVAGADTRAATAALLTALDDTQPAVQAVACVGIGRAGERKALARAAEAMRDGSRPPDTRAACAYALGLAGARAHVPDLLAVLAEGNDELARLAAWALGRIGDPATTDDLLRLYFGKRGKVRETIAWAAVRAARGGAAEPAPLEEPPLVGGALDHRRFIAGLGVVPEDPPPPPALLAGRAGAIAAGVKTALGRHRDVLVRVLADLDARDEGLALGALTAGLDAAPRDVRAAAETTLEAIAREIAPEILALGEHRDEEVRALALSVLAKLRHKAAPERLARALGDNALRVRLAALAAIERYLALTGRAPLSDLTAAALGRLVQAKEWRERVAAAELAAVFGPAARGALAQALNDPSGFVREAAARSLGRVAQAEDRPALLAATRDEVAEVRLAAVEAVARVADPEVRSRLAELAKNDPDPRVRAAAARAP